MDSIRNLSIDVIKKLGSQDSPIDAPQGKIAEEIHDILLDLASSKQDKVIFKNYDRSNPLFFDTTGTAYKIGTILAAKNDYKETTYFYCLSDIVTTQFNGATYYRYLWERIGNTYSETPALLLQGERLYYVGDIVRNTSDKALYICARATFARMTFYVGIDFHVGEVYDYDWVKIQSGENKVTSLSSESTDEEYPSAKCVYDLIGNVESLLAEV